jgi:UDP-glucose 4-epimerase
LRTAPTLLAMTPLKWLITGGAGYIGSHVADEFLANGKEVVIYDILRQGLEARVEYLRKKHERDIPLVIADIRDEETFSKTLKEYKIQGVVHTAALKAVGESMEKSAEYFEVNHHATARILEVMTNCGIHHMIFSSTAAVYGAPKHSNPLKEQDEKSPISPYGASKLAAEGEVERFLQMPGNLGTSLRFFNVIGTSSPELMDNSVENLIPIVINKIRADEPPLIFGFDYPTPDGTCIRDYVDVRDIARAHIVAAESKRVLPLAINVGTGRGVSVLEIIKLVSASAGRSDVNPELHDRRAGDSASLCADVNLMRNVMGLVAGYSIEASVESLF